MINIVANNISGCYVVDTYVVVKCKSILLNSDAFVCKWMKLYCIVSNINYAFNHNVLESYNTSNLQTSVVSCLIARMCIK